MKSKEISGCLQGLANLSLFVVGIYLIIKFLKVALEYIHENPGTTVLWIAGVGIVAYIIHIVIEESKS